MMYSQLISKHRTELSLLTVFLILILAIFLIIQFPVIKQEDRTAKVLLISKNSSEVNNFITQNPDYQTEIKKLTLQDLENLSKTQPVIYGNISKPVYQVTYKSEEYGLICLVDLELEKVLRCLRTIYVRIE